MNFFRLNSLRFACGAAVAIGGTVSVVAFGADTPLQALSPTEYRPLKLVNVELASPDTRRFRFAFPDPDMTSGINVASCLVLKYNEHDGKEVVRPYTPVTSVDQKGFLDLLVKRYPDSKMGSHLFSMRTGDTVEAKGPYEKIKYIPNRWKHIGMIAGGTGITPMFQIMKQINSNPNDKTKVSLIYLCKTEEDVLLAHEITKLGSNPNFYIYISLEKPKKGWLGGIGRISTEMVRNVLPAPGAKDTVVMVCGPPGLMNAVSGDKDFSQSPPTQGMLTGLLRETGFSPREVFKF
eukprot:PhF_6_TR22344/c0_g1_i1/m.31636/K00326/E1.6.2.2; cytochrome-b5 reductase